MNIYVKFKAPKTLREFLKEFFSNSPFSWGAYAQATYKDKECTKCQCSAHRSRSIQDMWDIAKTYYPNTELLTLVSELVALRPKGLSLQPRYCSTVRRSVMAFGEYKFTNFPRATKHEYNWGKLLRELGIKSIKEMYEYKIN